ncbi:MAG: SRPBCC family protein [Burkholderiales bacterium]|nr:SRPBCC family protein [Burkholderiales bacterium]
MARALPRLSCLVCAALAFPAAAAEITVDTVREGDALSIEARAEFEGTVARTWQVLTDYEKLPDFIPDLQSSRVLARAAEGITVVQRGEVRLLFFGYPVEVRLLVNEHPMTRVDARAVSGSFRELSGTYAVDASGGRVRLRYTARLVPDFFVPPLIGTWALRRSVRATFVALVEEIVRRQAGAPPPGSGEQ